MQTEVFSASGRRGTGKSTLLAYRLQRSNRVVLWDALGEHSWCPNPLSDLDDLEDFLGDSRKRENFAARYIPHSDLEEEFEGFCLQVYRRGYLTVGMEEIPLVCSSPSAMPPEFGRLVRLSRHRGLNVFWCSQRFAEVPRTLTALTDVFAIFQVSEPRDLDALCARTGPEIADHVAGLDLYEGIWYDVRTREALRITSRGKVLGPLSAWPEARARS